MFVLQLPDGRFYRESGSNYISSKKNVACWTGISYSADPYWSKYLPGGDFFEAFWTTDINKAKVFKSRQACRSSNAYSWDSEIKEVTVKIELI